MAGVKTISEILRQRRVNEADMIAVVQHYVKVRKGVDVKVKLGVLNWGKSDFTGEDVISPSPVEAQLLHIAFQQAAEWFAHNPNEQNG
jgi:hypothetical protein